MKLTIYRKMMLGYGAIITIMIIASTNILLQLNNVSNEAKVTLSSHVKVVDFAKQLQEIIHDENAYAQKYLISRDETYFSLFVETNRRVDQYLNSLFETQTDAAELSLIKNMQEAHTKFTTRLESLKNSQKSDPSLLRENLDSESMETLHQHLNDLISINQSAIGNAISDMETRTDRAAKIALLLIASTLLAAIAIAFFITRTITSPIEDLIQGTERIARGKFDRISVSSNDEIASLADAVNDMSGKIKKINELRTKIMHQISHEVKTPLQSMLSAHDLLKHQYPGPLNDEQLKMLETINRGITKLENFSNQYLDLAKIESGKVAYNLEPADLLEIVEPLVDDAKFIAASKNINVELSADAVPKVLVDVEKISIVINNLLSNAVKYTQKDGKITVKLAPCTLGALVEVQDSGIGIAQEDLPKVFGRFYQAENVGKIKSKGAGVGLALVKAYTEGHGGKVYVESTVDKGSTFTVELPAAQS